MQERAIYCVFKFLPLQCIISIFEAVLLEKKIIFVSQSRTILGFAIEAFLSFVFPFRWEHVLIPILPAPLKEYLSAPVPIIVGITPVMVDNTIESDVLYHLLRASSSRWIVAQCSMTKTYPHCLINWRNSCDVGSSNSRFMTKPK